MELQDNIESAFMELQDNIATACLIRMGNTNLYKSFSNGYMLIIYLKN